VDETAQADPTEEPTEQPETTDEAGTAPDATDAVVDEETPEPEPLTTAEPILVVPASDERADITGTLLFTRLGGDIWRASGTTLDNLTDSSSTVADSSPVWSPDGKHIYWIRSKKKEVKDGRARLNGKYTLYPTDLWRMNADGANKKKMYNALISDSRGLWFSTIAQPSVSPAGNNVVVVSDGKDGSNDGVTLHLINSRSGRMNRVATSSQPLGQMFLGHNDPDFNSDGTKIAFTYNQNAGTEGDPKVGIFTCQTRTKCTNGKTKLLKSGYANPSWSPDGKLLAVEAIEDGGRDIAIITAKNGAERVQLTNDGNSFAPEFSPNGDQIAYLKRNKLNIDVRVLTLEIDEKGKITLVSDKAVTSDGSADGDSGLSWYIPKRQLDSRGSVDASEPDASEEPDDALDEAPPAPPGS
jgi:Tol biopolymer transport system component